MTEHDAGNELVAAVRTTGLVKQLASLDLSRTRMTDEGAAAILENAAAFEHLESFNLAENDLSPSMTRNLEKRFDLAVDVEAQGMRYEPIEE